MFCLSYNLNIVLSPTATPLPYMASASRPPQTTPVNGLSNSSSSDERMGILQTPNNVNTYGCDSGKDRCSPSRILLYFGFFLGILGIIGLLVSTAAQVFGGEYCRKHIDPQMGRSWIECVEPAVPRFGPRRY